MAEQPAISDDLVRGELHRVLNSRPLRNSPILQRFLHSVIERKLSGRTEEIKESTLAIEVFGRPEDFDGKVDNVVRVHAHRLRTKLQEYYQHEGADDEIVIDIPKGHYVPRICRRADVPPADAVRAADGRSRTARLGRSAEDIAPCSARPVPLAAATHRARRSVLRWVLGGLGLFVAGWLLGTLTSTQFPGGSAPSSSAAVQSTEGLVPLQPLWGDLVRDEAPLILAARNPLFLRVRDKYALLLRYDGRVRASSYERIPFPADAEEEAMSELWPGLVTYDDTWTDIGTLVGIKLLTEMFTNWGKPVSVKKAQFVTLEDLQNSNVIFVGAPWGNRFLRELDEYLNFVFSKSPQGVKNRAPQPGEQEIYSSEFNPSTRALRATYGLLTVCPGFSPGRRIVMITGLNSVAPEGIARYVTSANSVAELGDQYGSIQPNGAPGLPAAFQVVFKVARIRNEVAETTPVAFRSLPNASTLRHLVREPVSPRQ